jgi:hypothetical protein
MLITSLDDRTIVVLALFLREENRYVYNITFKSMSLKYRGGLIFFLLISIVLAQNQKKENSVRQMELNQTYSFDLEPNQVATWEVVIKDDVAGRGDLFVIAQSPANEPLQQPFLTVKAGGAKIKQCDSASNEFSGVCRIDGSALPKDAKILVTAECLVTCHLQVSAVLQPRFSLTLNSSLIVRAPEDTAGEYEFELEVPLDATFTDLAAYA